MYDDRNGEIKRLSTNSCILEFSEIPVSGKLYVTKPDLGSYIGRLGGIILSLILLNVNHFFCHRFL
jgi:hypothetical protein